MFIKLYNEGIAIKTVGTCQILFPNEFLGDVSGVGDRFEFSPERFAPSIVPNFNGRVPEAARRALSNGIFSF